MTPSIEFVLAAIIMVTSLVIIIRYFSWLFFLLGIVVMGFLDYLMVRDFIQSWPPRTFTNGAELFCLIPFLTFGVLAYIFMFHASVSKSPSEDLPHA